jgi:hypothetical protein
MVRSPVEPFLGKGPRRKRGLGAVPKSHLRRSQHLCLWNPVMTALHPLPSGVAHAAQVAAAIEVPDRYELKYLISESQVEAVRRAIRPFCVMDPNCENTPRGEYGIGSLYLDTPSRDLFRISRERRARRWKARVRLYDGADRVFLEIKSKDHDMIKKQRARIPFDGWVEHIHREPGPEAGFAERLFCQRLQTYGLVPMLMVHYMREAWLSAVDSYARVTFDRAVVAQSWSHWSFDVDEVNWLALDGANSMLMCPRGVVLELKCLTAVPRWLTSVVQSVGLVRARYSKYCKGIERHFGRDTLIGALNLT